MLNALKGIYSSVLSAVRSNGAFTEFFDCPIKLKQGCIISSILFCIFITEIWRNHFLFVCKLYNYLRLAYLPQLYIINPCHEKMYQLLASECCKIFVCCFQIEKFYLKLRNCVQKSEWERERERERETCDNE